MTSVSGIEQIEEQFLKELYNLKLEDLQNLEKISESNGTQDIPDSILDIFKNTYGILNNKTGDELTKILESIKNDNNDDDNDNDNDNNDNNDNDNNNDDDVVSIINDDDGSDEDHDDGSDENNNDDDDDSIKSHNNSDEEEEEKDIEEQIKNSALEAVRYRIELEKERQYAGAYPRKQVGIVNTGVSCYANAAIQMLYSLPFYRKYYTEINENEINKNEINKNGPNYRTINNLFKAINTAANKSSIDTNESNCILTEGLNGQQDSSEYLMYHKEYIFNDVNKYISEKKYLCLNSNEWKDTSPNETHYVNISIKQKSENIKDCLEDYMHEIYDSESYPSSERCKTDTDTIGNIKEEIINIIPTKENRYLFFMLSRYDSSLNKITQLIKPNEKLLVNNIEYTLSGLVVHPETKKKSEEKSSIGSGHYIYIHCDNEGSYNTLYDDDSIVDIKKHIQNENIQYYSLRLEQITNISIEDINKNATIFAYTRYPVNQFNVANTKLQINTDLKENPHVFRPITPNPNPNSPP
jgi:hypothetical protein